MEQFPVSFSEALEKHLVPFGTLDILDANPLFRGLGSKELSDALELMEASVSRYEKGDMIHLPETPMERFGFVLSGLAVTYVDDIEGRRMIMAEVASGNTFGEALCFLKVEASPVCVTAAETTVILWLSLRKLYEEGQGPFRFILQKRFTAMLAGRMLTMNNRIQVLSRLRLRDKLIAYFTELSVIQHSKTVILPMNREDTAAFIGTDRSALSRELSAMKRDGLIDYDKRKVRILHE